MLQVIEANWIIFVLALLIAIAVAWWVFARGSTVARPPERKPDALDEGAAPARRNQALIDAPPAADLMPPMATGTMAGVGEIIAVAAQDEVEEEQARQLKRAEPEPAADEDTAPRREDALAESPAEAVQPAAATSQEPDDLRRIKGVGPKLVTLLNSLGVTSYAQIAVWTDADLDRLDTQIGAFAGRPRRDNWVEQAKLLSAGDTGAYEAKFGKL